MLGGLERRAYTLAPGVDTILSWLFVVVAASVLVVAFTAYLVWYGKWVGGRWQRRARQGFPDPIIDENDSPPIQRP